MFKDTLVHIENEGRKKMERYAAEAKAKERSLTAVGYYERLTEAIRRFDAELDNDHEVGLKLVTFGQSITFHVTSLGYHNPGLIMFYGTMDNGQPVELVQHISQISFLMTSVKRDNPTEPKKPFGFNQDQPQS